MASGSFPVNWLFSSGGQSSGALASASVLPMNIQGWFPLGLTGMISLFSKGLSRVFSSTMVWKDQFFLTAFFMVQLSHLYLTTGKTITLTKQTFVCKVMSLLFNTLSKFVIAFLPKSKHLLISWLSPSTDFIFRAILVLQEKNSRKYNSQSLPHFQTHSFSLFLLSQKCGTFVTTEEPMLTHYY